MNNIIDVKPVAESVPFDNEENGFSADNCQYAPLEQVSKNVPGVDILVKSEYTRVHPNLGVAVGTTVSIEVGGELIVP